MRLIVVSKTLFVVEVFVEIVVLFVVGVVVLFVVGVVVMAGGVLLEQS